MKFQMRNELFKSREDWKRVLCTVFFWRVMRAITFVENTFKDVRLCAYNWIGFSIEINEQICFTLNLRSKTKAEHKTVTVLSLLHRTSHTICIKWAYIVQSHPELPPHPPSNRVPFAFIQWNIVPMERRPYIHEIGAEKVRVRRDAVWSILLLIKSRRKCQEMTFVWWHQHERTQWLPPLPLAPSLTLQYCKRLWEVKNQPLYNVHRRSHVWNTKGAKESERYMWNTSISTYKFIVFRKTEAQYNVIRELCSSVCLVSQIVRVCASI